MTWVKSATADQLSYSERSILKIGAGLFMLAPWIFVCAGAVLKGHREPGWWLLMVIAGPIGFAGAWLAFVRKTFILDKAKSTLTCQYSVLRVPVHLRHFDLRTFTVVETCTHSDSDSGDWHTVDVIGLSRLELCSWSKSEDARAMAREVASFLQISFVDRT